MSVTITTDGNAPCHNCGAQNYLGELFVADAHGVELACGGCVAIYLSRGEWPQPVTGGVVV